MSDEQLRKWFKTETNHQTGIHTCSVSYGEEIKELATASHTDIATARDNAAWLAMTELQGHYPNCYLVSLF